MAISRHIHNTTNTMIKFRSDLHSRTTPHISPLRASYGVSFMSCTEKNDRDISRSHCIMFVIPLSCMYCMKKIFAKLLPAASSRNHIIQSPADCAVIQSSSSMPYNVIKMSLLHIIEKGHTRWISKRSQTCSSHKINEDYFQFRLWIIIIKSRNVSKPREWK